MPLRQLRNLGPTTERMLAEVGVESETDLRELGAPISYALLRYRFGTRVNRLFLYALAGALDGRDLHSYTAKEKAALTDAPRLRGGKLPART